ncbi:thioredoxin domain-containing protein [Brevibacterium moorei]|uniref:thioredoxin domain-containing protein n=1 Tax=Brevibacterium moorei TaxID=2968457 RepID=UPI00211BB43F|nr:DUF255 domain-containing protein [Brevibacterium sp. 68QC2CO]MCQ9386531.1 DUF255 domain-containing protein [Brevibacterium sp. 68QC2CO]
MTNRLANATSPYLRQHADNPVDWWPWGPEAFAEAARRDVPVMVSIGYSTCHWCHVMAHESFSDPDIAARINEAVVPIKVDREELPAVDSYYMNALQAFRGQGGWPLTAFTDHAGTPFFAGTYFPAEARPGLPALPDVLRAVGQTWRDERPQVAQITERLRRTLAGLADLGQLAHAFPGAEDAPGPTASEPAADGRPTIDLDELHAYLEALETQADFKHGGFGGSPKFPPFPALRFLIRFAWTDRADNTDSTGDSAPQPNASALTLARRTLLNLATGGIRDHLRGGLFRYTVDAAWRVPHFEKMLGDNAMYLQIACDWYRLEHRLDPGSVWTRLAALEAQDTATFLLRDMYVEGLGFAGFATALDADSLEFDPHSGLGAVNREGAYYTFTEQELSQALHVAGIDADPTGAGASDGSGSEGERDATRAAAEFATPSLRLFYGEHTEDLPGGVLYRDPHHYDPGHPGEERGPEAEHSPDARLLGVLRRYQDSRVPPERDEKFVSELGGLTIAALFEASALFDRPEFAHAAAEALRTFRAQEAARSYSPAEAAPAGPADPTASADAVASAVGDSVSANSASDAAAPSDSAVTDSAAAGSAESCAAALTPGPGAPLLADLLAQIRAELAAGTCAGAPAAGAGSAAEASTPVTDWARVKDLWDRVKSDYLVLDQPAGVTDIRAARAAHAEHPSAAGAHPAHTAPVSVYDSLPEPILGVRGSDPVDQVTPSGRSALAEAAVLLRELAPVDSGVEVPPQLPDAALDPIVPLLRETPTGVGYSAYVAALALDPVRVEANTPELLATARAHPAPVAVVGSGAGAKAADLPDSGPASAMDSAPGPQPRAQVCRGTVCELPVATSVALNTALDRG